VFCFTKRPAAEPLGPAGMSTIASRKAARQQQAALFFARFRPVPMLVPVICLAAIILRVVHPG
jgi:hypothetical protein